MRYCILGKDERSVNLRKLFLNENNKLVEYTEADVVITPIPFTKDNKYINTENILIEDFISQCKDKKKVIYTGALKKDMLENFENNNINFVDLMQLDELALLNAIPTAEGAICEAISNTDFTINGSNILITGFGRIGKVLANMLSSFGANILCEARKEKDIALIKAMGYNEVRLEELDTYLPSIDIVFNTIPVMVFADERLKLLKQNCLIIDLASTPGGIDFKKASELGLNVKWALALPSKYAPKTAAKYIKDTVLKLEDKQ